MVSKSAYMKDLDDVDPFNISRVYRGKESEQGKRGVDVTNIITYKTSLEVNRKPVTVSLALGEGVAHNTIFLWPFLKTIKPSIMNEDNALVSGLLGEKFRLEMMVAQRAKESPKKSERLQVSLTVVVQEKQYNMNYKVSRNITVELKKTATHQHQIPGQH